MTNTASTHTPNAIYWTNPWRGEGMPVSVIGRGKRFTYVTFANGITAKVPSRYVTDNK